MTNPVRRTPTPSRAQVKKLTYDAKRRGTRTLEVIGGDTNARGQSQRVAHQQIMRAVLDAYEWQKLTNDQVAHLERTYQHSPPWRRRLIVDELDHLAAEMESRRDPSGDTVRAMARLLRGDHE